MNLMQYIPYLLTFVTVCAWLGLPWYTGSILIWMQVKTKFDNARVSESKEKKDAWKIASSALMNDIKKSCYKLFLCVTWLITHYTIKYDITLWKIFKFFGWSLLIIVGLGMIAYSIMFLHDRNRRKNWKNMAKRRVK
jgi:hypothetical protein